MRWAPTARVAHRGAARTGLLRGRDLASRWWQEPEMHAPDPAAPVDPTPEGRAIARAKGRLRGRRPELSARQQAEARAYRGGLIIRWRGRRGWRG